MMLIQVLYAAIFSGFVAGWLVMFVTSVRLARDPQYERFFYIIGGGFFLALNRRDPECPPELKRRYWIIMGGWLAWSTAMLLLLFATNRYTS